MATRLDRVSTTSRLDQERNQAEQARARRRLEATRTKEAPLAGSRERLRQLTAGERELPSRALGGAMASWLALTFGLCYVLLPSLAAITGVNPGLINTFWFDLPSFAIASFVAIIGVLVERPRIDLSSSSRDPVLAAMVGGLGVWALIHNVSAYLVPFADMSFLQFTSLFAINIVEMGMLGMMFASFSKRTDVALALGGGFQLGMFGLLLTLISLVV
ncbi:MAG: hypothetical protein AAGA48_05680 [Myxococcota bacterium]